MVAVWPVGLPQTLSGDGSYKEGTEETGLFSKMDAGNIKTRPRFTRAPAKIVGTLLLTSAQVTTWKTFIETTLRGATLTFTGALTRTGITETYQFTKTPDPASHMGGDNYIVNLELLRLPS